MKSFYITFLSFCAPLTSFAPHLHSFICFLILHSLCSFTCASSSSSFPSSPVHRSNCRATNICIVSCCFRNNSSISPFWRNNSITVVLSSIGGIGGGSTGVSFSIRPTGRVSFSTHPPICVIYRASCLYTLSQYSHLYSGSFDNSTQIK